MNLEGKAPKLNEKKPEFKEIVMNLLQKKSF